MLKATAWGSGHGSPPQTVYELLGTETKSASAGGPGIVCGNDSRPLATQNGFHFAVVSEAITGILRGIAIPTSTFRRARTGAEKQQRRDVILSAARELGLRNGVRNVTLGDVASEVGLAKSSVLRYFETREEVYLQITADGWRDWTEAARARLARAAQELARSRTHSRRPLWRGHCFAISWRTPRPTSSITSLHAPPARSRSLRGRRSGSFPHR